MGTTHKLDYSALTRTITPADISNYTQSGVVDRTVSMVGPIGVLLFFGAIILALTFLFRGETAPGVILLGMLLLFSHIIRKGLIRMKENTIRLHEFALSNDIMLSESIVEPGYSGTLFTVGLKRSIPQALTLPDGLEIGNVAVVIEPISGKTIVETIGYVKVPLTRTLPNMLLDAAKNNIAMSPTLSAVFSALRRTDTLSLEGDFNKHFKLYAPQAYHADALYVFTPDVMAALMDNGTKYDIEIIGSELYMYSATPFVLHDGNTLSELLTVVDAIAPEIRDQTKRYRHESKVSQSTGSVIASTIVRKAQRFSLLKMVIIFVNISAFVTFAWIAYTFYAVITGDTAVLKTATDALRF